MSTNRDTRCLEAIEHICEKLEHRQAVLFLGAGINYGIKNADGNPFPLGQGLADMIAIDLLHEPDLRLSLPEVSDMAKTTVGPKVLNDYIIKTLASYQPGPAHTSLVQLPWDTIYTTNYDTLVEKAFVNRSENAEGRICTIFSSKKDLAEFSEKDILYYKLHGCIESAHSEEGRLILTKEDFRFYEKHRKRLFRRLELELSRKTFVFIGYSLADNNLAAILDDCIAEAEHEGLPLSFSIRPGFKDVEESHYKRKYNLQLIDADGAKFLRLLKETWDEQKRSIVPFEHRKTGTYLDNEKESYFDKLAESFYKLSRTNCTGKSDATRFFSGGVPRWSDIRDQIAPRRDVYWSLLDTLLTELTQPSMPPTCYLVTGAAGTGKTTLIRTLAFDIAKDSTISAYIHIPGTPFDVGALASVVKDGGSERIVVFIDHAADDIYSLSNFIGDIRKKKLPITLVLEERKNQWLVGSNRIKGKLTNAEFELSDLSSNEICLILDALSKYRCLGKLAGMERLYQEEHFTKLAKKELLVALRELTSDGNFDEIVRNEYEKIPSKIAKDAYLHVAALGQIDLPVRFSTLQHVLGIDWNDLGTEVFTPTAGVLLFGEETGWSRHNADFRLSVRHPIIGSIIFDSAAPDDHTKFEIINRMMDRLDPGHFEDRKLLNSIVQEKGLIGTFISPEFKRAVFDRLLAILPDDEFVMQHRAMLEKDLENPDEALKWARKAVKANPDHLGIRNTLGLALELAARDLSTTDSIMKKGYLDEARKIFVEGIKKTKA